MADGTSFRKLKNLHVTPPPAKGAAEHKKAAAAYAELEAACQKRRIALLRELCATSAASRAAVARSPDGVVRRARGVLRVLEHKHALELRTNAKAPRAKGLVMLQRLVATMEQLEQRAAAE